MKTTEKLELIQKLLTSVSFTEEEKLCIFRIIISEKERRRDEINRMMKYPVSSILNMVSTYMNIPVAFLRMKTRNGDIVLARHMVYYKAAQLTGLPLKDLGFIVANQQHSTVLSGISSIKNYLETNRSFREKHEKFLENE
jgi:chromosomal replication initiation ATPase DnaA